MGTKPPQIDRQLDVEHSSKVETVELDRRVELNVMSESR